MSERLGTVRAIVPLGWIEYRSYWPRLRLSQMRLVPHVSL